MKRINKISSTLLCTLTLLIFYGCTKDDITSLEKKTDIIVNQEKLQNVNKFISITWKTPLDKIIFDDAKQEFIFGENGEYQTSKENMIYMYDQANEYKAKYEN